MEKMTAITGMYNSGKTMFLTSLLWQLDEIERAVRKRLEKYVVP